jgi:hypothetical protein
MEEEPERHVRRPDPGRALSVALRATTTPTAPRLKLQRRQHVHARRVAPTQLPVARVARAALRVTA